MLSRGAELGVPLPQDDRPTAPTAGTASIVPDYAGFGRSDKPTDRRWYTYDRHSELMTKVLGGLDLQDAIVVVQDWGGPIGLRWAVQNADRVGALAIFNTGLFTGRVSKGLLAWRDFAEKNPDLPVGFVIQGATATELPDEVVAAYDAPFPNAESKAGAAQFPLLVPTTDDAVGRTRDACGDRRAVTVAEAGARRVLRSGPHFPVSEIGSGIRRPHPDS